MLPCPPSQPPLELAGKGSLLRAVCSSGLLVVEMALDVMRVSVGPDLRDLLVRVELDHVGELVRPFFTCQRAFSMGGME